MSMSRIRRSAVGVVGASIAASIASAAFAAPASAAPPAITITSANGTLTVQGTAGPDDIVVRGTASSLAITAYPSGSVLAVPSNCSAPPGDTNDATCAGPFTKIVINGGDGDDDLNTRSTTGVPTTLSGGSGDDLLIGSPSADTLNGGNGDDSMRGGAGDDFLSGGFGPFLESDADHQDGGTGTDTVSYFGHNPGAVVTRDGKANDGQPGEKDNVDADVEIVVGRVQVLS